MAIALVSNVARVLDGTTASIDTNGATLLAVMAWDNSSPPTVSDSKSNTWVTALTACSSSFSGVGKIFYVENPTVGTGHTFTIAGLNLGGICVAAFSGVKTSATAFDAENTANAQSSPTSTALTPNENDELVVTGHVKTFTGTPTVGNGFSVTDIVPGVNGVNYGGGLAYIVQTSAGSANPAWTFSSGDMGVALACFKAAAGGGGGNPWYAYAQMRERTELRRTWGRKGFLWTPEYVFA